MESYLTVHNAVTVWSIIATGVAVGIVIKTRRGANESRNEFREKIDLLERSKPNFGHRTLQELRVRHLEAYTIYNKLFNYESSVLRGVMWGVGSILVGSLNEGIRYYNKKEVPMLINEIKIRL